MGLRQLQGSRERELVVLSQHSSSSHPAPFAFHPCVASLKIHALGKESKRPSRGLAQVCPVPPQTLPCPFLSCSLLWGLTCLEGFTSLWLPTGSGHGEPQQEEGRKERLGYLLHQSLPRGAACSGPCPSTPGLGSFKTALSAPRSPSGCQALRPRG